MINSPVLKQNNVIFLSILNILFLKSVKKSRYVTCPDVIVWFKNYDQFDFEISSGSFAKKAVYFAS